MFSTYLLNIKRPDFKRKYYRFDSSSKRPRKGLERQEKSTRDRAGYFDFEALMLIPPSQKSMAK